LLMEAAGMNPHIDLLLLGPSGDDQYWHALQQNKPVNVHMPGAMAEISEILAGADYFVSASRHEGIPVSVLEAGAMGLPCLLSDIPGHRVLQEKSEQTVARYFEVNNLKELVRSMREMEASALETQQMGHRLHQLVKDHFSSESMHLAYQKIYMKV